MLELTDNDETTAVPDTLPPDFLVGDADYDDATGNITSYALGFHYSFV
jgi:hypothetical protein